MEKRKLLLAEGNEEFSMALESALRGSYSIRVCADGLSALELMGSFRPDVLVVDMLLPGLDGVSLLQNITEAGQTPMVLATTRYCSDYMLEALERFGVGYLMIKPCNIRATVARIGDLSGRIRQFRPTRPDPETAVSNLLRLLRVPTRLQGYGYLREAVVLVAQNPDQSMTKELYPTLAKPSGTHWKNVERAIRGAIDAAWQHRDDQLWGMYFPPEPDGSEKRPNSSEFIKRLADSLRQELSDCG